MKKKLKKYVKKRLKRIVRYLQLYSDRPDHDTLHKLRLELKKIRALLRLLGKDKKFNYKKRYAPFKEIFKACGAIRDPHVMRKLSEKITGEVFPPVTENPQRILEFRESVPAYISNVKKVRRPILREAGNLKSSVYKKYVKSKQKQLKARLYPKFKKKRLHSSRRLIKEIGYLLGITKKKKKIAPFYDKAGDIIGDWHDTVILTRRLKDNAPERTEQMEEIQNKGKKDLKMLRAEIKQFYKAA